MGYDKVENSNSSGESESESDYKTEESTVTEKKKKPGIIYLSSIPEGMNVSQTTLFFSEFGRVGRVFLQPDTRSSAKEGFRHFTEGWVEFLSKKAARRVADQLNNTPVGGKRRSKSYSTLWNIKYLPRFKWVHLSERLAYEAAVKQQRMRTEISQVKREVDQFKSSVSQEKKKKKKRKRDEEDNEEEEEEGGRIPLFHYKQKETDSAIRKRKAGGELASPPQEDSQPRKKKSKKSKEHPRPISPPPPSSAELNKKGKKKKKKEKKKPARGGDVSHGGKSSDTDRSAFLKSVFGGGSGATAGRPV